MIQRNGDLVRQPMTGRAAGDKKAPLAPTPSLDASIRLIRLPPFSALKLDGGTVFFLSQNLDYIG